MTASTIHRNIGHGPRAPCFQPGLIAAGIAFGAYNTRHLTQQLEMQGREENYQQSDQTLAALEGETAEIYLALAAFTQREVSTA